MTELEVIGSQILIFNSGRFFAVLNNSCKSAGTLANVVVARKMKLDASQFACLSMVIINKAYDFNS